jgi:hypothetical protein
MPRKVALTDVDDPRLRIVMAMIRAGNPVRQADIAASTKFAPQLVDYHLRTLAATGVVIEVSDIETGRYYALQEPFYDTTFMEGMAQALLPLARTVSTSIDLSDDHDPINAMKETIRFMVNVFLCTVGRNMT